MIRFCNYNECKNKIYDNDIKILAGGKDMLWFSYTTCEIISYHWKGEFDKLEVSTANPAENIKIQPF